MWTTKHGGSSKTVEIEGDQDHMIDPAYMIGSSSYDR